MVPLIVVKDFLYKVNTYIMFTFDNEMKKIDHAHAHAHDI